METVPAGPDDGGGSNKGRLGCQHGSVGIVTLRSATWYQP